MDNFILVAILILVLGSVVFYIVKAKKRGEKCIGCPYAKECANKSNGCNCNKG